MEEIQHRDVEQTHEGELCASWSGPVDGMTSLLGATMGLREHDSDFDQGSSSPSSANEDTDAGSTATLTGGSIAFKVPDTRWSRQGDDVVLYVPKTILEPVAVDEDAVTYFLRSEEPCERVCGHPWSADTFRVVNSLGRAASRAVRKA
jgi:hypothetical protein